MGIKTILVCDKCQAVLELSGPYHTVKEEMKEEGFRNIKTDDGWEIRCPNCRGGRDGN